MRRAWPLLVGLLVAVLAFAPLPVSPAAHGDDLSPTAGSVLAAVGRQAAYLNLDAPRPRLLTRLTDPNYISDLAAVTATGAAPSALAVQVSPFNGNGAYGSDLLSLDTASGTLSPVLVRASGQESLGEPAWLPDASAMLFERSDLSVTPIAYPGQSMVYYPTRIEWSLPDGTSRIIVVADGRMPAVSPDATQIVYLRSSAVGTALLTKPLAGGDEVTLLPETRFVDLSYPRYSPQGDRIAFMAPGQFIAGSDPVVGPLLSLFGAPAAYAHGAPWDMWMVNADGTDLHLVARLGADDASLAWSPDGSQIFVYSGNGSTLVDPNTGQTQPMSFLVGYGAIAWLP